MRKTVSEGEQVFWMHLSIVCLCIVMCAVGIARDAGIVAMVGGWIGGMFTVTLAITTAELQRGTQVMEMFRLNGCYGWTVKQEAEDMAKTILAGIWWE